MKRFAVSFLGVLMIVMAVSGCTGKKPAEQYVSEQLNCSLPAAEKSEASDTHGGFHGEVWRKQGQQQLWVLFCG